MTHEGSNGGLWHRISQNKSKLEDPMNLTTMYDHETVNSDGKGKGGDLYAESGESSRYSLFLQFKPDLNFLTITGNTFTKCIIRLMDGIFSNKIKLLITTVTMVISHIITIVKMSPLSSTQLGSPYWPG